MVTEVGVDLHCGGGVGVAHPALSGEDVDSGFVVEGAAGMAEDVGADGEAEAF